MYQIQDQLWGCGGVLQLWHPSVDVDTECCEERNVSCRVQFEDICRDTTRPKRVLWVSLSFRLEWAGILAHSKIIF